MLSVSLAYDIAQNRVSLNISPNSSNINTTPLNVILNKEECPYLLKGILTKEVITGLIGYLTDVLKEN